MNALKTLTPDGKKNNMNISRVRADENGRECLAGKYAKISTLYPIKLNKLHLKAQS